MKILQVDEPTNVVPLIVLPKMSSSIRINQESAQSDNVVKLPGKPVLQNSPKSVNHDVRTIKVEEPQFVPYEPYKAAVNPIFKTKKREKKSAKAAQNSNSNIQEILRETTIPFPLKAPSPPGHLSYDSERPTSPKSSLPLIRVNRRVRTYSGQVLERPDGSVSPENAKTVPYWKDEKLALENELKELKEDKNIIESQLQTQTQVNAELKKLLVASVGEDIQQRVQFLTEDKARLAEDVVSYSQRLITDYEEMEKLSIQCDVWRSKYLASSVMVDELAKWKALLSRKFDESKQVLELMLSEHKLLRDQMSKSCMNLQNLRKAFDPTSSMELYGKIKKGSDLNALSILQISALNTKLTDELKQKLLGHEQSKGQSNNNNFAVTARTQGEECAYQVLSNGYHCSPNDVGDVIDFPTSGLIGTSAKYLDNSMVCNSCSHCCGEVKQI